MHKLVTDICLLTMSEGSIRECSDHGFFVESSCPECSVSGEHVISGEKRRDLSGFATWALRHAPDEAGINVDSHGWADVHELVDAAREDHEWATVELLAAVVSVNSKGRFEVDGNRIRAVYGHSIDVTVQDTGDSDIPKTLYHGTPTDNLSQIMSDGLKPMNRNEVHLTDSLETARDVGERHSEDIAVLEVDADNLSERFDIEKRGNDTYTVDEVPTAFISKR